MGILDDAIKEHLELKRQHGADASELKQLEDEAFGEAERPGDGEAQDPFAEAPTEFMSAPEKGESPRRAAPDIASLQEAPERQAPAAEPEEPSPGHSTEERHAIAEQPTEMYDVEGEISASESRAPT